MTRGGKCPLLSTRENCPDIEVTDDDIKNSVRAIPKVKTLVRIMPNFIVLFFNNTNNNYYYNNNKKKNDNNIAIDIIKSSAVLIGDIENQIKINNRILFFCGKDIALGYPKKSLREEQRANKVNHRMTN